MLKKTPLGRYPRLTEISKNAAVIEQFEKASRKCWRLLIQDKIDSIIRSMTTSMNGVREAEGWYTLFWRTT